MKILPAGQKMHEILVLIGTEPLWRVACGAVLLSDLLSLDFVERMSKTQRSRLWLFAVCSLWQCHILAR